MGLIRLLLALSVIVAHAGSIFGLDFLGGPMAVQSFFIISGFYMSLVLNEKYIGAHKSYTLFLSNRLLRLFPIYWVVLLLTIILVTFAIGYDSKVEFGSGLQYCVAYFGQMSWGSLAFLIFIHIFLIGQDMVMFLGLDIHTGHLFFTADFWKTSPQLYKFLLLPQAWTIGIEITFYLIAPFIVRRKPIVILSLIFLSIAIRILLIRSGLANDPWTYRFFPSVLVFFLLGNLSYHIYKRIENAPLNFGIPLSITLLVLLFSMFFHQIMIPHREGLFFIVFFLAVPFIFKQSRHSRIDAALGNLSYPVYICHSLIGLFLGRMTGLTRIFGDGLTEAILAIGFSLILNKVVGVPIERIRQKRVYKGI